ncbi:MAG TPA: response regulator [Gemmatimonadales bacterium]|nr:response regulator [Gemmatimonadales bacterium]
MGIIVVVEDQPDSLKLLSTLLTLRGHTVIPLGSGDTLVETMRTHAPPPDLVLLDIQLPGRDGYALLQDLKTIKGDRPWKVVALTAHAMPADRAKALAAGFDGYITKPIDIRTFPTEVAGFLGPAAPGGAPEGPAR